MKSQAEKEKVKIAKEKKQRPYGSWDPFTQAKYIRDLGEATGQKISTAKAYEIAVTATKSQES